MVWYGIFIVQYCLFDILDVVLSYVVIQILFIVVKDVGFKVGKGVIIVYSVVEVEVVLCEIFIQIGVQVVIEDFMIGQEVSILVLIDGKWYVLILFLQDYKIIYEGDIGLMIGGMGVICFFLVGEE